MKFPSFHEVLSNASMTIRRFPFAFLVAVFVSCLAMMAVHASFFGIEESDIMPMALNGIFAFPIVLGLEVMMQDAKLYPWNKRVGRGLLLIALLLSYFGYFQYSNDWEGTEWLRFVITQILAVLMLFILPFSFREKKVSDSFWVYVIGLVLRFAQAFVYFGIFFLGLAALLAAINFLLFEIDEEIFADVWILNAGILASLFFMFGIPAKLRTLHKEMVDSKQLKVLVKYFLVPLAVMYMAILYVYSGKIVLTWQWPEGEVAGWTLGFLVMGTVTYFFANGVREKAASYLDWFKKWFFVGVLPLLVVLFLSLWIRIGEYGVTELRYFGVVFGLWLLIVALYFVFARGRDLRMMCWSLALFLLVSAWGPFSAFNVSLASQMERLEDLFVQYEMFDGGVLIAAGEEVSAEDAQEMNDVIRYIVRNHGVENLQSWFEDDLEEALDKHGSWSLAEALLEDLDVNIDSLYDSWLYRGVILSSAAEEDCSFCVSDISGYDFLIDLPYVYDGENYNGNGYGISRKGELLSLSYNEELLLEVDFEALFGRFVDEQDALAGDFFPSLDLSFPFASEELVGELRFKEIHADFKKGDLDWTTYFEAEILYNEK